VVHQALAERNVGARLQGAQARIARIQAHRFGERADRLLVTRGLLQQPDMRIEQRARMWMA
jgi:hypothetical protein